MRRVVSRGRDMRPQVRKLRNLAWTRAGVWAVSVQPHPRDASHP